MSIPIVNLIEMVARLILTGIDSKRAVDKIAREHNVDFATLWNELPDVFK